MLKNVQVQLKDRTKLKDRTIGIYPVNYMGLNFEVKPQDFYNLAIKAALSDREIEKKDIPNIKCCFVKDSNN